MIVAFADLNLCVIYSDVALATSLQFHSVLRLLLSNFSCWHSSN
jgi:hypothetical protein